MDTLPTQCTQHTPKGDPNGQYLYGMQSHPNWTLLKTKRDTRIVVYINKKIISGSPKLLPAFSSRDTALLSLKLRANSY